MKNGLYQTTIPEMDLHRQLAAQMGFTRDELERAPAQDKRPAVAHLDIYGKRIPLPAILNAHLSKAYDLSACNAVKDAALQVFRDLVSTLVGIEITVSATNGDSRFSESGRAERRQNIFKKDWVPLAAKALKLLPLWFVDVAKELRTYTNPARLAQDAVVAAMLDQEYRAVTRGLFAGDQLEALKRARKVQELQINDARHPLVAAVLRADPVASAVLPEHHLRFRLVHGVQLHPDQLRAIWGAAAMADIVAYALDRGTERAAAMCGMELTPEHRELRFAPSEDQLEIAEMFEVLAADAVMIEATGANKVLPEKEFAPLPDPKKAAAAGGAGTSNAA